MDLCVEHGGTSEKWGCSVCFPGRILSVATAHDTMEEFGPQPKLPLKDAERKALPIFTFLTQYFPDVIVELTKLCVAGNIQHEDRDMITAQHRNIQHNPELPPADIKWAREKSTDQLNTAFRHAFDRGTGTHYDADGQPHLIKAIWRYMAQRQLDIEEERKTYASRG